MMRRALVAVLVGLVVVTSFALWREANEASGAITMLERQPVASYLPPRATIFYQFRGESDSVHRELQVDNGNGAVADVVRFAQGDGWTTLEQSQDGARLRKVVEGKAMTLKVIVTSQDDNPRALVSVSLFAGEAFPMSGQTDASTAPDAARDPIRAETEKFAATVLGLAEQAAIDTVQASGRVARVSMRDGEGQALTMDYSPSRINLKIANGRVAAVSVG